VRLGRHKSGWRHSSDGHYDHKVVKIARHEYRMAAEHTRVAIVMHSDFGTQLPSLTGQFHVWVVDTPVNRRAAEAVWAVGPGDRAHGVTTFKRNYSPYPVVDRRRIAWGDADQMLVEFRIRSSGNVTVPGWSIAA
jgi:hypothetical protein